MSNRFTNSSEVLKYVYEGQMDMDPIKYTDELLDFSPQRNDLYLSVLKEFGIKKK